MPVCISHMHTQTEKRERVKTHTLTYYQTRHYITCILDYRFYFLLFDISIQHFNLFVLPLDHSLHISFEIKEIKVTKRSRFNRNQTYSRCMRSLWSCTRAWRTIIIRDVNFDHFNTHIHTKLLPSNVPLPLLTLLVAVLSNLPWP